jgi:tape measure domain-containing protein
MPASKEFEMASAYVSVMPSFENLSEKLSKEFRKAIPAIDELGLKLSTSFTAGIGDKLSAEILKAAGSSAPLTKAFEKAVSGLGQDIENEVDQALPSTRKFGEGLKKGIEGTDRIIANAFKISSTLTAPLNKALKASVAGVGQGLSDTVTFGLKTATAAAATSLGAVTAQALGGGFNRAMGLNAADAKLKALGYQGEEFAAIMKAAGDSVDGTAYTLQDSVGASVGFLAAGIKPGEELHDVLRTTVKLADISGESFDRMGSMMSKNAASGVVQMDDLNQLMDAGVPITAYLAKNLGKSVAEIKKMSSAGDISFNDLAKAIDSIDFDSALLASKDVGLALKNVRAQLSKQGANLWTPVVDGLLPILIDARTLIIEFGKQFNFTPVQTKISDAMKKIREQFDIFKDADGKIDGSKVKKVLEDITSKFEQFKATIKGFEGPIVGVIAGMSGSLLAGIPIIGPAFAGITPMVGLFAGTLFQAYQHSKSLQDTIKGLFGWFGKLGGQLATIFTGKGGDDPMGAFGDKLAKGIQGIQKVVEDIVGVLVTRAPEIREAFGEIWGAIKQALGDGQGITGDRIGRFIVDTFKTFAGYVSTAIPIIAAIAKTLAGIVTSDFMARFFEGLGKVATYVAGNEGVMLALGITLSSLFVAGKLSKPLMSAIDFIGKFKAPKGVEKVGETVGTAVGGFVKGIAGVFKIIAQELKWIVLGIAALAVIYAELAGIGYLVNLPGVKDALNGFGDLMHMVAGWAADLINQLLTAIMPAIDKIVGLVATIVEKLTGVWKAIADVFDVKAVFTFNTADIAPAVDALNRMFSTLADKGVAAGIGGYAAAAGLGALMLALGGGSAAAGAGNLIGAIFSGIAGKGNPLDEMLQAVERLAAVNAVVLSMPISWTQVLGQAVQFGLAIPEAIASGILSNSAMLRNSLGTALDQMMSEAQAKLDATPLMVRAQLDSNFAGASTAGNANISNNTYNNQRNTTVMATGFNSLDAILRSGRGR